MTGGDASQARIVFLVGYRCTGKSTVGRLLAARLGWTFADSDDLVEAAAQKSIKAIFATEGEPAFRDLEAGALVELGTRSACVVATGGGMVLRPSNRELLKARGFVVWLTAAPEVVLARLQIDPTTGDRRPNLTAAGGEQEVRSLIAFREPLYRDVADFVVATDALSPQDVADAIFAAWVGSRPNKLPQGAS